MFGAKVMQKNGTAKENFQSPLFEALAGMADVFTGKEERTRELEEELARAIAREGNGRFCVSVGFGGLEYYASGWVDVETRCTGGDGYFSEYEYTVTSCNVQVKEIEVYGDEDAEELAPDAGRVEELAYDEITSY